jgi:hypothetical protein
MSLSALLEAVLAVCSLVLHSCTWQCVLTVGMNIKEFCKMFGYAGFTNADIVSNVSKCCLSGHSTLHPPTIYV